MKAIIFCGENVIQTMNADTIFQDAFTHGNTIVRNGAKIVAIVPKELMVILIEDDQIKPES